MSDDEETVSLLKVNEQLRTELETLRKRVEDLREMRCEDEDEEEFDEDAELLSLENELLRTQLLEQQRFLEGCRLLAEQLQLEDVEAKPEDSSSSSSSKSA